MTVSGALIVYGGVPVRFIPVSRGPGIIFAREANRALLIPRKDIHRTHDPRRPHRRLRFPLRRRTGRDSLPQEFPGLRDVPLDPALDFSLICVARSVRLENGVDVRHPPFAVDVAEVGPVAGVGDEVLVGGRGDEAAVEGVHEARGFGGVFPGDDDAEALALGADGADQRDGVEGAGL